MKISIVIFILSLLIFINGCKSVFTNDPEVIICENGKSRVDIVVGKKPIPAEKKGVEELVLYLNKVTGSSFNVVKQASPDAKAIFMGQTEYAKQQGISFAELDNEEWIIRTVDGNLILTGGRPRGTIYAVYEFLESQVGIHWYDLFTEHVPDKPNLIVQPLNLKGKPLFCYRDIWTSIQQRPGSPRAPFKKRYKILKPRFHAANKLNGACSQLTPEWGDCEKLGTPSHHHTLHWYLPPEIYFKEHPEYYPLKGGKRTNMEQINFMHPEVRAIFKKKLRKNIEADREKAKKQGTTAPKIYDISVMDRHVSPFCDSAEYMKIYKKEGGDIGPVLDFINEIADDIREDYPDVSIRTFAYSTTKKPPKNIRPRDNVIIQFADYGSETCRPLTHPHNKQSLEYLQKWAKIATIMNYDYWRTYEGGFKVPTSIIRIIPKDIQTQYQLGGRLFFVESQGVTKDSFHALRRWLGAKMLENPHRDPEPLIQNFLKGYYGPAAELMNDYLAFLEKTVAETKERIERPGLGLSGGAISIYRRPYLNFNYIRRCEEFLDKAEDACQEHPVCLRNVRRERIPVDNTLLALWDRFERSLQPGEKMPFDREKVLERYYTNRLEQINLFAENGFRQAWKWSGKKDLDLEMAKLRAKSERPPLPDQFKEIPRKRIVDLFWPYFPETSKYGVVPDLDATEGKALTWNYPKKYIQKKDFPIGLYNFPAKKQGPSLKIKLKDIPQDEKFHWYKLGTFDIDIGTILYSHWTWGPNVKLDQIVENLPADNTYEAHVSLKITGPNYVKGSTKKDAVAIDRIILVKPETRAKAAK